MGFIGFKWVHENFAGSTWVPLIGLFLNGSKRVWVLNGVGSKWGGSKWGGSYGRPSGSASGAFQGIIHFCGLFSEELRRSCERPRGADW